MNIWHVHAHGALETLAQEPADSLKGMLRECMARPPRRINRYIRLALIGAHRCVAQLDAPLSPLTPLYLASEQGNVAEGVDLMDEILVHRRAPMPMPFINVSSNMVGYYLADSLGLAGRNMSVARHHGAFGAMLELANLEATVDPATPSSALLGCVTECVWPLAEHRRRCGLPADTPLVEGSYWLVASNAADAGVGQGQAQLGYARTHDADTAAAWLAAGECWVVDPRLGAQEQSAVTARVTAAAGWHAPLCHSGHSDALVHALFKALYSDPVPCLHAVAGDPSGGYQLMGVWSPRASAV